MLIRLTHCACLLIWLTHCPCLLWLAQCPHLLIRSICCPQSVDQVDMLLMSVNQVDTVQEASVFKKFCCEKCPYASSKRSHFQRHVEVHGSKQRYTCRYCDYSVPSASLLLQHQKIHMMPNQNLLASQSLSNLQQLPKVGWVGAEQRSWLRCTGCTVRSVIFVTVTAAPGYVCT